LGSCAAPASLAKEALHVVKVLLGILGISLLVIIHESGHYLAARAFGMRVLRYSIGLGPALVRYQPKGSPTIFQVCAVPFLAYVQIDGMNPAESVDPDDPGLYANKGMLARFVTIMAGPAANYLFASLAVFILALSHPSLLTTIRDAGMASAPPVVSAVVEGSPAEAAGLQEDDLIVEANGKPVPSQRRLIGVLRPRAEMETVFLVERGGERIERTIVPNRAEDDGRGLIGVQLRAPAVPPMGVGEAARQAVVVPFLVTVATLDSIRQMIRASTSEGLVGPVGMTRAVADSVEAGWRSTSAC
jgi:regulator of sigma E protease